MCSLGQPGPQVWDLSLSEAPPSRAPTPAILCSSSPKDTHSTRQGVSAGGWAFGDQLSSPQACLA